MYAFYNRSTTINATFQLNFRIFVLALKKMAQNFTRFLPHSGSDTEATGAALTHRYGRECGTAHCMGRACLKAGPKTPFLSLSHRAPSTHYWTAQTYIMDSSQSKTKDEISNIASRTEDDVTKAEAVNRATDLVFKVRTPMSQLIE